MHIVDWNDRDEPQPSVAVHSLVVDLASGTAAERRRARDTLVDVGGPAVPALVRELNSPLAKVRTEAVRALGEIGDPEAAPALVQALDDDDSSVRETAVRGLMALGRAALVPLLERLAQPYDSAPVRDGARQVLRRLVREGTSKEVAPVLDVLDGAEPPSQVSDAAQSVLESSAWVAAVDKCPGGLSHLHGRA